MIEVSHLGKGTEWKIKIEITGGFNNNYIYVH